MKTPYDIVREKCIVANPDILKFIAGCKIIYNPNNEKLTISKSQEEYYWTEATDVHGHSREVHLPDCEILGREIRLSDVLNVLNKIYQKRNGYCSFLVGMNGSIYEQEKLCGSGVSICDWNLTHDSLEWHRDNAPEVVDFLAKLLDNK